MKMPCDISASRVVAAINVTIAESIGHRWKEFTADGERLSCLPFRRMTLLSEVTR